jgi:pilus assembly protein CpaB
VNRRTIAIVAAVVLALIAAALVWWYVASVKSQKTTEEEVAVVLVAKQNIPAGTTGDAAVQNQLVGTQEIPKKYLVTGALGDAAALKGKVFETAITQGQQIAANQVGVPETQALAFQLEKGYRAVALPLDKVRGAGGTIRAGDRIDVIVTLGPGTRILLQQVPVLQADNFSSSGATSQLGATAGAGTPVIILKVTPVDAERLVYAQEQGKIWFEVIPATDKDKVQTFGRTAADLYQ